MLIIILFIVALSLAADYITRHIPFEVEKSLISNVNIDTPAEHTGSIPEYLQSLANDLGKNMNLPEGMTITVSVVNSPVVNAFATLGGNVVFFTGLLNVMPDENTLAMVMSHEIAHIKLRHPLRALGRGMVVGIAIATLAGVTGNDLVNRILGDTSLVTALGFSREQESAADKLAVEALVMHYGHAAGSESLFKTFNKLDNEAKPVVPEFFSTHPLHENRTQSIKRLSEKNGWPITGTTQSIPEPIKTEINRRFLELESGND